MAFNKIQPQQVQLPTFYSDSGNLTFTDNGSTLNVELSDQISSNNSFNFLGGIETKGVEVVSQSSGISLEGSGNISVGQSGGSNMRGVYNVALGGMTSDFNAIDCGYNVSLGTQSATFGSDNKSNVSIGGNSISFSNQTTGAIVLAASDVGKSVLSSEGGQIFIMSDSGVNFQGVTIVTSTTALFVII